MNKIGMDVKWVKAKLFYGVQTAWWVTGADIEITKEPNSEYAYRMEIKGEYIGHAKTLASAKYQLINEHNHRNGEA